MRFRARARDRLRRAEEIGGPGGETGSFCADRAVSSAYST